MWGCGVVRCGEAPAPGAAADGGLAILATQAGGGAYKTRWRPQVAVGWLAGHQAHPHNWAQPSQLRPAPGLTPAGWQMVCPFPGDLFVQFPGLQRLYISANNFTVGGPLSRLSGGAPGDVAALWPPSGRGSAHPLQAPTSSLQARACLAAGRLVQAPEPWLQTCIPLQGDINDAASMLAALPDLQEWAASASNVRWAALCCRAACLCPPSSAPTRRSPTSPYRGPGRLYAPSPYCSCCCCCS